MEVMKPNFFRKDNRGILRHLIKSLIKQVLRHIFIDFQRQSIMADFIHYLPRQSVRIVVSDKTQTVFCEICVHYVTVVVVVYKSHVRSGEVCLYYGVVVVMLRFQFIVQVELRKKVFIKVDSYQFLSFGGWRLGYCLVGAEQDYVQQDCLDCYFKHLYKIDSYT